MKPVHNIVVKLLIVMGLAACSKEQIKKSDSQLLIGRWNSYEVGTQDIGFVRVISSSLTIAYESGLSFSAEGTFKNRWHNSNLWTEGGGGSFKFEDKTISLVYFEGTKDEVIVDLQIEKLDETHLWFKHNYFGPEVEHHLERVE